MKKIINKLNIWKKFEIIQSMIPESQIFNLLIWFYEMILLSNIVYFKNYAFWQNKLFFFINLRFISDPTYLIIIISISILFWIINLIVFIFLKINNEQSIISNLIWRINAYTIFFTNTFLIFPIINIILNSFFQINNNLALNILSFIYLILIFIYNYIFLKFFNEFSLFKTKFYNFIDNKYLLYELLFKYIIVIIIQIKYNYYASFAISFYNFFIISYFLKNINCLNINFEKYYLTKHCFFFIFPIVYEIKIYYNEESFFWIIYSFLILIICYIMANYILERKYKIILSYKINDLSEKSNILNYTILIYNIINNKIFNYFHLDLEFSLFKLNKKINFSKKINNFKFEKENDIVKYNNYFINIIEYLIMDFNDVSINIIYFQLWFKFKKEIWKIMVKIDKIRKSNYIDMSLRFNLYKLTNLIESYFKKNKKKINNFVNLNIIINFENKLKNFFENISLFILNYNLILYELNEEVCDCNRIFENLKKMINLLKVIEKEYSTFEEFEELKVKIDYTYIKFLFIIINKEKEGKRLLNIFIDNVVKNYNLNKKFKKNVNIESVELKDIITNDNKYNIIICSLKSRKIVNSDNNIKKYLNFDKTDIINQNIDILIPKYMKKCHNDIVTEFITSPELDILHDNNNFWFINDYKFYLKFCSIKTKILNNFNKDVLIYNYLNYNFDNNNYLVCDINNFSILGLTQSSKNILNIKSKFTYNNPNLETNYKLNYVFEELFDNLNKEVLELNKIYDVNYNWEVENINKVLKLKIEWVKTYKIESRDIGIWRIDYQIGNESITNKNTITNEISKKKETNNETKSTKTNDKDNNNVYEVNKKRKFKLINFSILLYFVLISIVIIIFSYFSIYIDYNIKTSINNFLLISKNNYYLTKIIFLTRKIILIKTNLSNEQNRLSEYKNLLANNTDLLQNNKLILNNISSRYLKNNVTIKITDYLANGLTNIDVNYFDNLNSIITDTTKFLNFWNSYNFNSYKIENISNNELRKILNNIIYNGQNPLNNKIRYILSVYYNNIKKELIKINYIMIIIAYSLWAFLLYYFLVFLFYWRIYKLYIKKNIISFSLFSKEELRYIIDLIYNFKTKYLNLKNNNSKINKWIDQNNNTYGINVTKFLKTSKIKNNLYSYKKSILNNLKKNKDTKVFEKIKYFNNYNYKIDFYKKTLFLNLNNIVLLIVSFLFIFYNLISFNNYIKNLDYIYEFGQLNFKIVSRYNIISNLVLKGENRKINTVFEIRKFQRNLDSIFKNRSNIYYLLNPNFKNQILNIKKGDLCSYTGNSSCNSEYFKNKGYFLTIEYFINNIIDINFLAEPLNKIFNKQIVITTEDILTLITSINLKLFNIIERDLNFYFIVKTILFILYNVIIIFVYLLLNIYMKIKYLNLNKTFWKEVEDLINIIPSNIRENNELYNLYWIENKNIKSIENIN